MPASPRAAIAIIVISLLCFISCFPVPANTPGEPLNGSQASDTAKQQPPTDITAPLLSSVSVVITDNNSVIARWNTDEEASSEVKLYDVSGGEEAGNVADGRFLTDHELTVDGNILKSGVIYSLSVISRDRAGNMASHDNVRMLSVNMLARQNAAYRIFDLSSLEGNKISLADFKGKLVFLHFWLYGCHACEEELPLLNSIYISTRQDEMPVLTISIGTDEQQVADYVKRHGFKFPVLLDYYGNISSAYDIGIFPTTCIIDANGTIIKEKEGRFESLYEIREFMGQKSYVGGF